MICVHDETYRTRRAKVRFFYMKWIRTKDPEIAEFSISMPCRAYIRQVVGLAADFA